MDSCDNTRKLEEWASNANEIEVEKALKYLTHAMSEAKGVDDFISCVDTINTMPKHVRKCVISKLLLCTMSTLAAAINEEYVEEKTNRIYA
jgi:hypothetical protein